MLVPRSVTMRCLCGSAALSCASRRRSRPGRAGARAAATPAKRVYTPADFARFAPKTAYDMLVQVPSFTIVAAPTSERGLGQASENVLINGQRIANKSGGAVDQLQAHLGARTSSGSRSSTRPASASPACRARSPTSSSRAQAKSSGQFEWDPSFRAHFAKPELLGGSISYSGKTGPVDYTLSVKNDSGRGGFGGPILIYDRNGVLTETPARNLPFGISRRRTSRPSSGSTGPARRSATDARLHALLESRRTSATAASFVTGETRSRDQRSPSSTAIIRHQRRL